LSSIFRVTTKTGFVFNSKSGAENNLWSPFKVLTGILKEFFLFRISLVMVDSDKFRFLTALFAPSTFKAFFFFNEMMILEYHRKNPYLHHFSHGGPTSFFLYWKIRFNRIFKCSLFCEVLRFNSNFFLAIAILFLSLNSKFNNWKIVIFVFVSIYGIRTRTSTLSFRKHSIW